MKTFAQAAGAIEQAWRIARGTRKPVRYGNFLRALPDFTLQAIAATGEGEKLSGSLTLLTALRVDALLEGRKGMVSEPENDVLVVAAKRVYEDALIELVRRGGFLERFDPAPNPFEDGPRRIRLSAKGHDAFGDERAVLDNLCKNCEVI